MAFKSKEELVEMLQKNPGKARGFVKKAEASGTPVVDENNPGYAKKMVRKSPVEKSKSVDDAITRRIINNRKKNMK